MQGGDHRAIQACKHAYCYGLDDRDPDRLLECFAEGATLDVSVYGTATGADELREFVNWVADATVHTAHLVANPVIDVDGDVATGTWYYAVLIEYPDGKIEFGQGRYDDEFRRVDGEWRLSALSAERQIGVPIA